MCQFYDFIHTREDHFVGSRDIAASDCADTDLLRVSLLDTVRAVIDVFIGIVQTFIDTVSQSQGGSAGRILLLVVVALNDLDIKSGVRQCLRCLFDKLDQQVDAQLHICRAKHRDLLHRTVKTGDLFF